MNVSELREKRDTLRKNLGDIFTEAKTDKGEYDFRRVKSIPDVDKLEGYQKSLRVSEIVQEKNAELNKLCEELESLEKAVATAQDFDRKEKEPAKHIQMPGDKKEYKSVGQRIVEHPTFKNWVAGSMDGKIVLDDVGLKELKADFLTSAGWAPESTRTGQVVDAVTRPIQLLDIMPTGNTGQANVVYMEETTRTHAAAEVAEAAAVAESTFALTERTSAVREIGDSVPVSDVQLEDVAMVQSYLDGRLRFGVEQRLDGQMVTGNGTAPNLRGILNVVGIQTQAKGTDPVPDAIFKAGTKVRVTGRAVPTHVLLHPNDWQEVRLLRTADGIYIWGSPSEAGPERIWGWPVVQNDSLTENTGLIGSFQPQWVTLFNRRGITVERGFINDQFTKRMQTIRATMRAAFVVFRPAAFATITSI